MAIERPSAIAHEALHALVARHDDDIRAAHEEAGLDDTGDGCLLYTSRCV